METRLIAQIIQRIVSFEVMQDETESTCRRSQRTFAPTSRSPLSWTRSFCFRFLLEFFFTFLKDLKQFDKGDRCDTDYRFELSLSPGKYF